jgi:hypothetical protein
LKRAGPPVGKSDGTNDSEERSGGRIARLIGRTWKLVDFTRAEPGIRFFGLGNLVHMNDEKSNRFEGFLPLWRDREKRA